VCCGCTSSTCVGLTRMYHMRDLHQDMWIHILRSSSGHVDAHHSTYFSCIALMGWLRSVGSIKLQISFTAYHFFYRALLQKRPIILSILLSEATPYKDLPNEIYIRIRVCTYSDLQPVALGVSFISFSNTWSVVHSFSNLNLFACFSTEQRNVAKETYRNRSSIEF